MKPPLSEEGSVELGVGVLLVVCGSLYFLFPGREPASFLSGMMVGAGVILIAYGYVLRRASSRTRPASVATTSVIGAPLSVEARARRSHHAWIHDLAHFSSLRGIVQCHDRRRSKQVPYASGHAR
jgi:hypothetical protein